MNTKQIKLLIEEELEEETNPKTDIETTIDFSETDSKWKIRHFYEKDYADIYSLCRESFPLDYPESWFRDVVTTNKYISFGLFYSDILTSLLIAELKLVSQCDAEDRDLFNNKQAYVVYILSLAVKANFRRMGIATLLLNYLMENVVNKPPLPKIVFLHVLSKNLVAINFYKRNGFRHLLTIKNYYHINDVYYDGYTFAIYMNGATNDGLKKLFDYFGAIFCTPFRLIFRLLKIPFRISN